VGEPNLHEFPLSLMLAIHFPEFVPRVVSYRERWNAWLTLEAGGAHLDENSGVTDWARAAETLASLQITSFGRALHLLAAGCKDVRIPSLLGLVDPFFAAMAERMEEQTKPSPQPLLRQEVLWLAAEIKVRLEQLAVCDIPNTLGHLDFNPGNILVSGERCVILDWAEACVGHPFFTLQYLLEHARRLHGDDPAWEEPLIKSYAKKWELYSSPEEIAAALQLVPLIAAFAYAAAGMAWRDSQVGRRPEAGGYLRSLTRRMKREADALREGSLVCLR
jgi:Ser/Thr protein kinase RdoA (MazF antagonist)